VPPVPPYGYASALLSQIPVPHFPESGRTPYRVLYAVVDVGEAGTVMTTWASQTHSHSEVFELFAAPVGRRHVDRFLVVLVEMAVITRP